MAVSGIEIGQVLHGTYRVTREIAEGGMGVVYEGEHLRLAQKKVAIKVLLPQVMQYPQVYQRFRREAEVVCSLGHPNIVYVIDFNELENGQPYMIMEYLDGEDLDERLTREKQLSAEDVGEILVQAGNALQVVHDQEIVHRDLKPQNILMMDTADGKIHIKLLDFGISKIRDSKSVITRDQAVMGTPFYMSPEQAKGSVGDIDPRTDIFALAAIAYHCLTGQMPFDAPTIPGVLYSVCYEEPRPATELVDNLPQEVDLVLGRAMAKKRKDRYQRVEEFVADMRELLARGEATQVEMSPFMLDGLLSDTDPERPALDLDKTQEQPAVSRPPIAAVASEEATVQEIDLMSGVDRPESEAADEQPAPPQVNADQLDGAVTPMYQPAVKKAPATTGPLPAEVPQAVAGTIDEVSSEVIDDDVGGPTAEDNRPTARHRPDQVRRQRTKTTLSTATGERPVVPQTGARRRTRWMMLASAASVLAAAFVGIYVLVLQDDTDATTISDDGTRVVAANHQPGAADDQPGAAEAKADLSGAAEAKADLPGATEAKQRGPDRGVDTSIPKPPPEVTITLELSPKDAVATIDGKRASDSTLTMPRSKRKVTLRVSAPNHRAHALRFAPNRDRTLEVTLKPKKQARVKAQTKKPRKGPKRVRPRGQGKTKKKPVRLFDDL